MGFLDSQAETQRKKNLEILEDKRLRFVESAQKQGFVPDEMMMASTDRGGVYAIAKCAGKTYVVLGPDYAGEGEYVLEEIDPANVRAEEFLIPSEGMGGIFGFGKRGQVGFVLHIDRGGVDTEIPFVVNRNSCLYVKAGKNLLMNPDRRRGNANPVWDFPPVERKKLNRIRAQVEELLGRKL